MLTKDRYKSNIAFVDLLFNILIGFVFLFIIAFILINPIAKKSDIEKKAEFLVVMTWPDKNIDDVDLWLRDPAGNLIGFRTPSKGFSHLERDDLGDKNDMIFVNGETLFIENNTETITIRGILQGDYDVSTHFYRRKIEASKETIPVTVTVSKLNPYSIVYKQTIILDFEGDIKNFYTFTLDRDGKVIDIKDATKTAVGVQPDASRGVYR